MARNPAQSDGSDVKSDNLNSPQHRSSPFALFSMNASHRLQSICDKAYSYFCGSLAKQEAWNELKHLMDQVTLKDLHLSQDKLPQTTAYMGLANSNLFNMCTFVFPKGTFLPIHDHPGMTVMR